MSPEIKRIVEASKLAFQNGRIRAATTAKRGFHGPKVGHIRGRSISGGAGWQVASVAALYTPHTICNVTSKWRKL
jgi:hypothetical protein